MISRMDYQALVAHHGHSPEAVRMSAAGQLFRFQKLLEIDDLRGRSVLDLGCGCGHFYPVIKARFPDVEYLGIDIVSGMVAEASHAYPSGHFVQRDVLSDGLGGTFDYVLMSALFNDPGPDPPEFLRSMASLAFAQAKIGIGFNFISSYVNEIDDGLVYHDPTEVTEFVIENLTRRMSVFHHYERCDVAIFAYR
jgi:SAM-dependent methyltransferase